MDEIQTLKREVAELRKTIDEVDDWANGVQMSLVELLPLLLIGHPNVGKAQELLERSDARFEELSAHPLRGEKGETAALYESRKMLYRLLALRGVWPGIDPQEFAEQSIQKYRQR